jgi:hypothetical protein
LLEAQPALRRLKDGLVDAQLRTAQLLGKMNADHPEVRTAMANEDAVRQQLRSELDVSVRSLKDELQVNKSLIATLETQLADVDNRLNRLAGMRARYGNLVSEVRQRGETLQKAQQDLSEARASQAAAQSASLVTRLDAPVATTNPIGPDAATIIVSGTAGGLAIGLGLVFLFTPGGPLRARRWGDYLPLGRRSTDRVAGRRAKDIPNPPAERAPAADGNRRGGQDRRVSPNTASEPAQSIIAMASPVEDDRPSSTAAKQDVKPK